MRHKMMNNTKNNKMEIDGYKHLIVSVMRNREKTTSEMKRKY